MNFNIIKKTTGTARIILLNCDKPVSSLMHSLISFISSLSSAS